MAFNFDLVDPAELTGYMREVPLGPLALEQILPNQVVPDLDFRFTKAAGSSAPEAATYRTFDTESPIGRRRGVVRVSGSLPPISRKIPVTEEETLRQRSLLLGTTEPLVEQIYDDAGNLVTAIHARLELARADALVNGSLTIAENGLSASVDFQRNPAHEVVPVIPWSTVATATVLQDLITWRDVYIETNGVEPGAMLTSNTVIGNMLRNAELRTANSSIVGAPARVRRVDLDGILDDHALPPIVEYNTRVNVNGVLQRVIPADRVIFLPPSDEPLGHTLFGLTAEGIRLAEEGRIDFTDAPGIVGTVETDDNPVTTWTNAAAVAIPLLANADLTLAADVQ